MQKVMILAQSAPDPVGSVEAAMTIYFTVVMSMLTVAIAVYVWGCVKGKWGN